MFKAKDNHSKMSPRKLCYGLTTLYWNKTFHFFSLCLNIRRRIFRHFWLPRSNNFQLYANTTAFCEDAVSGTLIFSICAPAFSLLTSQEPNILP